MFELGDKVRIKTKEEIMSLSTTDVSFYSGDMFIELEDDNSLSFLDDMGNTHDTIGEIIDYYTDTCYKIKNNCSYVDWIYHESWLEKVEDK